MSDKPIQTYEQFWPFYLREHSKPATRLWHFVGSSLGLLVVLWAFATGRPGWAPLGLLPGYGFAWYSHFFIEKNRPASFKYPLWSFISDWKMWGLMLSGRIGGELRRHLS